MRNNGQTWLAVCFLAALLAAGSYVASGHDLASGTAFMVALAGAIAAIKK